MPCSQKQRRSKKQRLRIGQKAAAGRPYKATQQQKAKGILTFYETNLCLWLCTFACDFPCAFDLAPLLFTTFAFGYAPLLLTTAGLGPAASSKQQPAASSKQGLA